MTAGKSKAKSQTLVGKPADPEPITADFLHAIAQRAMFQFNGMGRISDNPNVAMQATALYRLAMDANHLALLIDHEKGQKRFTMLVRVAAKKPVGKKKPNRP